MVSRPLSFKASTTRLKPFVRLEELVSLVMEVVPFYAACAMSRFCGVKPVEATTFLSAQLGDLFCAVAQLRQHFVGVLAEQWGIR